MKGEKQEVGVFRREQEVLEEKKRQFRERAESGGWGAEEGVLETENQLIDGEGACREE